MSSNNNNQTTSWIGIDYFAALRSNQPMPDEESRRIPSRIENILCLRYSTDGETIAAATSDGCIGLYDVNNGKCKHFINKTTTASPPTSLRFRANLATETTNSVLLAVYSNGQITEWNFVTGENIRHLVEPNNQILAVDYRSDFKAFATGGKDTKIRVYDETTGQMTETINGHSNRIFSLCFKPSDNNVLLSGGWDNNVKVWDLRTPQTVAGILFGPHMCGDGIDVLDDIVVTASWRQRDVLELWDLRKMKQRTLSLPWQGSMLYSAAFSKCGPVKVAGAGVNKNEFKVFEKQEKNYEIVHSEATEGSYSLDFSPSSQEMAVAGAGNKIGIFNIKRNEYRDFGAVGFRKVLKT